MVVVVALNSKWHRWRFVKQYLSGVGVGAQNGKWLLPEDVELMAAAPSGMEAGLGKNGWVEWEVGFLMKWR